MFHPCVCKCVTCAHPWSPEEGVTGVTDSWELTCGYLVRYPVPVQALFVVAGPSLPNTLIQFVKREFTGHPVNIIVNLTQPRVIWEESLTDFSLGCQLTEYDMETSY